MGEAASLRKPLWMQSISPLAACLPARKGAGAHFSSSCTIKPKSRGQSPEAMCSRGVFLSSNGAKTYGVYFRSISEHSHCCQPHALGKATRLRLPISADMDPYSVRLGKTAARRGVEWGISRWCQRSSGGDGAQEGDQEKMSWVGSAAVCLSEAEPHAGGSQMLTVAPEALLTPTPFPSQAKLGLSSFPSTSKWWKKKNQNTHTHTQKEETKTHFHSLLGCEATWLQAEFPSALPLPCSSPNPIPNPNPYSYPILGGDTAGDGALT